jgi:hypothetical protein
MARKSFGLFIAALVTLCATDRASALDIVDVSILYLEDRRNDVPGPTPFSLEVLVEGTDISDIDVTTPAGSGVASFSLVDEGGGEWEYSSSGYADSASLISDFNAGDYLFEFTGTGAEFDQITLTFDPTAPTDFIDVQDPAHGSTGVATSPTVTWLDCSGCGGDLINMWVINTFTGDDEDSFETTDTSETTWNVGAVLDGNTLHELETGIVSGGVTVETTDLLSDSFDYGPGWENVNITEFTTLPEPNTASLLLLGLLGLARLRAARRAV